MTSKGNKAYSVLHGVCPSCQQGKIFESTAYTMDFTEMNDHCPVCGQAFEPEPDFYQGAMYVSYGLSTVLFMVAGVLMLFYLELGYLVSFSAICLGAILLLPVIFRVSRLIWINLFVKYRPLNS